MHCEVEISSLDLRYEGHRLRHLPSEKALLSSILENGIREPLMGVIPEKAQPILLDGFKRVRCCRVLGIGVAPFSSLDKDESSGIVKLLRLSIARGLSILEQAAMVDDLKNVHKLSVVEIAQKLEKSPAWVSVRSGIIAEMSDTVRSKLFGGRFPVYSYMYTLRHFMRLNKIRKNEIDDFVKAVSGKNLSTRDIERLAYGYFNGPEEFRAEIQAGNVSWGLKDLTDFPQNQEAYSEFERSLIRDLETTGKCMERVTYNSVDPRLKTPAFFVQANLLAGGILNKLETFSEAMRMIHDRSGNTESGGHSTRQGGVGKQDQPSAGN